MRCLALALATVSMLASGCASAARQHTTFTHVTIESVSLYRDGPQQARPPETTLPAGTQVRVIETAGSYSRVELADGSAGYVITSGLRRVR